MERDILTFSTGSGGKWWMLGLTNKRAFSSGINVVLFIVIKGLWMIHLAFQHPLVARRLQTVLYMH